MNYLETVLSRLRYQFCPMCKSDLVNKVINDDGIERVCCPNCNWVHYPTNAIGVVVLITTDDGVVAILPHNAPKESPAALPGGHAEYGETPEEAAVREAFEETGMNVEITQCLGWEFKKNINYPGPMLSFYFEAKAISGVPKDSEEGQVRIYQLENFPPIAKNRQGSKRTMELFLHKKKGI
jgi:ADP-ribose pyrophosphatase YjhB (NUDIX family)